MKFLKDVWNVTIGNTPSNSEAGKVNYNDLLKLARDGALVGVAAVITFSIDNLNHDLIGDWTPAVITVLSVALKGIQRLVKNNKTV